MASETKILEARQDIIDKPPEEADWVADYHLLQSALDGPIIDAARKWHAAYRKAQNSNLMRAKEVERLRSENKIISDRAAHHEKQDATEIELLAARIKELEAVISEAFQELVTAGPDIGDIAAMSISLAVRKLASQNKRLEAAFLGATKEIVYAIHEGRDAPEGEDVYAEKEAREALEELRRSG